MTIKEMRLLLQGFPDRIFQTVSHSSPDSGGLGKRKKESAKLRSGTVGTCCKGRRRKELDMAWYEGTFACGHEGRVNIIGPQKDRGYKKERAFSRLCPDCWQKERDEKIKKIKRRIRGIIQKEYGFPDLTGEKNRPPGQTRSGWNCIRRSMIDLIVSGNPKRRNSVFQRPDTWDTVYVLPDELPDMVDTGIQEHTEAKFWIEHRSLKEILTVFYDEMMERKKEESIPEEVKKELAQEVESLTVRPEGGTKPGVVEIKYTENYIKLYYPKDDDFRKIVKDHRYSWDGIWKERLMNSPRNFPDRAGEIGKALLTGGFTVRFPDMAAKEKALTTYIPECDRWIKRFEDRLAIWWTPYNEKIYKAARSLPGASWGTINRRWSSPRNSTRRSGICRKMGIPFYQKGRRNYKKKYKEQEAGYETVSVPVTNKWLLLAALNKENEYDKLRSRKTLRCRHRRRLPSSISIDDGAFLAVYFSRPEEKRRSHSLEQRTLLSFVLSPCKGHHDVCIPYWITELDGCPIPHI